MPEGQRGWETQEKALDRGVVSTTISFFKSMLNQTQKNKSLGAAGEIIAANFLIKKGYQLIEKNVHAQGGEIDLVMKDPENIYTMVEVKTRKSNAFGDGASAITKSKLEKICSAAEHYFLKKLELNEVPDFQIDAVIVEIKNGEASCEHFEDVGMEDCEW